MAKLFPLLLAVAVTLLITHGLAHAQVFFLLTGNSQNVANVRNRFRQAAGIAVAGDTRVWLRPTGVA